MDTTSIVGQVVQLQLLAEQAGWQGFFDQMQVWRSMSGPDGPFEEVTAPQWSPARVPPYAPDPPAVPVTGKQEYLNGKTFQAVLEERTTVTITFAGVDPITRAAAATQITQGSANALTAYVAEDGSFVVQSTSLGVQSILRVSPTDGSGILGVPSSTDGSVSGSVGYGHDARITLTADVENYAFTDPHSHSGAFYKTRYYNDVNGNVSDFSAPFPATSTSVVDSDQTVVGYLDIVDAAGVATANREVRLDSALAVAQVDGKVVAGIHLEKNTDQEGHVEFRLLRGIKVTVGVAGTRLARTITTPTDPAVTRFSLFDAGVGSDDVFVVQRPTIDFAFRSTL